MDNLTHFLHTPRSLELNNLKITHNELHSFYNDLQHNHSYKKQMLKSTYKFDKSNNNIIKHY